MQLRLPWLKERWLLLSLAGLDAAALGLLYNFTYWVRLGTVEGVNRALVVLIGLWLGGSYLLGRYSRRSEAGDGGRGGPTRNLARGQRDAVSEGRGGRHGPPASRRHYNRHCP